MRNFIEGKPVNKGLHEASGVALQYRVCRTVSSGQVVKKHADFFEEYRRDPTGDHSFDPIKLQATVFLSDYGVDYRDGGFFLWDENFSTPRLFGRDISVNAGDLVFWRYSQSHEVRDVSVINSKLGFLRVIFPQFDTKIAEESPEFDSRVEASIDAHAKYGLRPINLFELFSDQTRSFISVEFAGFANAPTLVIGSHA